MARTFQKRLIAWLLPAVLVFAQQAALAHLVAHAAEQSAESERTLVHLKLCDDCASAAKFVHLPAGQSHRLDLLQTGHSYGAAIPALSRSAEPARPAARDPPYFL